MHPVRVWFIVLCVACGPREAGPAPQPQPAPDSSAPADTDTSDPRTDTGSPPVDPATVPLGGTCPLATHLGGFGVEADDLLTVAGGAVSDGVVPVTVLEEVGADGDCVLLRRNNLFCDPPCAPGETCGFDGACVPYPIQQDMGTVTIEGLHASVTMEPSTPGYSYYELGLPHPAYDPGALVTLRASGGVFGPFVLYGVGLVPLALVATEWVMFEGQDFVVAWEPPPDDVRSTVHLRVTIDQHGVTPVQLECDFADVGQGTVPAAIVDQFVGYGVTGFPSASLVRRTVDSLTIDAGCLDFDVSWTARPDLRVDGHVPCSDDSDCPAGQTCDTSLEICA